MRKVLAIVAILVTAVATHISADDSDMSNVLKTLARSNPIEYEAKMKDFVEAAKAKDVDKMVQMTSPVTRKQAGDDALRTLYAKGTVPLFQIFSKMSEGGSSEYVKDETGSEGWVFKKTFTNAENQSAAIYIVVLKENGKLYVSSLGIWKK